MQNFADGTSERPVNVTSQQGDRIQLMQTATENDLGHFLLGRRVRNYIEAIRQLRVTVPRNGYISGLSRGVVKT